MDEPQTNDDYRPISILSVLSMAFEKLALQQITVFSRRMPLYNLKSVILEVSLHCNHNVSDQGWYSSGHEKGRNYTGRYGTLLLSFRYRCLWESPAVDNKLFNGNSLCKSKTAHQHKSVYLWGSSGINSRTCFVQPLRKRPIFCFSMWSCVSLVCGWHDNVYSFEAIWSWSQLVGDLRSTSCN